MKNTQPPLIEEDSPAIILIVEDDPVVSKFLCDFLSRDGHIVLTATEGGQALDIVAKSQYKVSLVITDMAMPGMDGKTTIAALRKKYPEIRMVAMSGAFRAGRKKIAGELGVEGVLYKPFMPAELRSTVRAALA